MVSLRIALTGYAVIGLTLLILAASIAGYMLSLKTKSRATWALIVVFIMVALSGAATILANAFFFWDRLFVPWQDFWILASGIALAQFAYTFAGMERSREARIALLIMGIFLFAALAYCLYFDYNFLVRWTPDLNINDLYYLLLPLGTLLVVIIFLRLTVKLSIEEDQKHEDQPRRTVSHLFHPEGSPAQTLRNLALALSLAFLPGIQTVIGFQGPLGFILSNVGSLMAIIAIALVYFNYAPEVDSFLAKLVGISLSTVLFIFSVIGALDIYQANQEFDADRVEIISLIYETLSRGGELHSSNLPVSYIVSWNTFNPKDSDFFRWLYRDAQEPDIDLGLLLGNNEGGNFNTWSGSIQNIEPLTRVTGEPWWVVRRYITLPPGDHPEDYQAFFFINGDSAFEIGFSRFINDDYLSEIVIEWLVVILISSGLVLLLFPIFFRRTLVRPLQNLLAGIRRVNEGELDTAVPIKFNDEIGFLTRSFNDLTFTLKATAAERETLFSELQASHAELEERVTERTRELAAFTDLTMLSGDQGSLTDILHPALKRTLDLGLCEALAVHLLALNNQILELVDQRLLPQACVQAMTRIELSGEFALRVHSADDPLLLDSETERNPLPEALRVAQFNSYLGCSLMAGDQAHGWLSCYRSTGVNFSVGEISLIVALARQIGILIENYQLREEMKRTAAAVERRKLGRDLHDSVTQLLYSMTLFTRSAKEAQDDGDQERLTRSLNNLTDTSMQALREMRFLLFELQPPVLATEGLAQALQTRLDVVEKRVGIKVNFDYDGTLDQVGELDQELYYVAIEALNNALKHGQVNEIALSIYQENHCLCLDVVDNGQGFEPNQVTLGLGLPGMRQRVESLGGELIINSHLNQGTEIKARIPTPP